MATRRKSLKSRKAKAAQRTFHKKAKKKSKLRRVSAKRSYKVAAYTRPDIPSYEEVVLKNIMSNDKDRNVPDEAILLSSAISSLSGSMKELHYRSGISIGKELFKIQSAKKRYVFPEESVADLVAFFESAGYRHVTYMSYPGSIEIKIHDKKGPSMGTSLHSFEAGIISGFLSAANQRYINVSESSCVNNDEAYCRFAIDSTAEQRGRGSRETIERLVNHITQSVGGNVKPSQGVANEYYLLASSLLLDKSYIDSVKSIASYMGRSVGDRFSSGRNGSISLSQITGTIRMLNLGNPLILDTKPFHMQLTFDGGASRRGFVDLSLAFVSGLLSSRLKSSAVATEMNRDGSYVVDIKERG